MKIERLKALLEMIRSDESGWPSEGVEISLENEIITRSEIKELVSALKNRAFVLNSLSLRYCGLDNEDAKNLMQALESHSRKELWKLDLSGNRIGKGGAIAIADTLKNENIEKIHNLILDDTKIDDRGMEAIANAIVESNKVEQMFCRRGNGLTVAGVKDIINLLISNGIGRRFEIGVATRNGKEDKEVEDAVKEAYEKNKNEEISLVEKIDDEEEEINDEERLARKRVPFTSPVVTYLPAEQFNKEWSGYNYGSFGKTLPRIDKLNAKINFLAQKYPGDEKIKGFVSALNKLSNSIKEDVTAQLDSKNYAATSQEAKRASQSSAMVILRATDEMLEKVLKEDQNPGLVIKALEKYATDCQHATQWTVWQKLVCAVIGCALTCLSVVCPPTAGVVTTLLVAANGDPLHALYIAGKTIRAGLPKAIPVNTTFFTPYRKLVSDVLKEKVSPHASANKSPEDPDNGLLEEKKPPEPPQI